MVSLFDKTANLPLLSEGEICTLCREAQRGSTESRNLVVERNLRLVLLLARRYSKWKGLDEQDCIQHATLGLMRAVATFDQSRGRWSPHATRYISNYLTKCLQESRLIRTPEWLEYPNDKRLKSRHLDITSKAKRIVREDANILKEVQDPPKRPMAYDWLYSAVDDLPAEEKCVIVSLLENTGETYSELANRAGRSNAWVGRLKTRALLRLRKTVDEFA